MTDCFIVVLGAVKAGDADGAFQTSVFLVDGRTGTDHMFFIFTEIQCISAQADLIKVPGELFRAFQCISGTGLHLDSGEECVCLFLWQKGQQGLAQGSTVQGRGTAYGGSGDDGIFRHFLQNIEDFPSGELSKERSPVRYFCQFRKFRGDQLQRVAGIRIRHADPVSEDADLVEL